MKPSVYSFPSTPSTSYQFPSLIQLCLVAKKIQESSFIMDKANHSKDKQNETDQVREQYSKEANEFFSSKKIADDILPHILNLYGSRATPRDFEIYAPDASFEDPLMCAHGVKQIKSAFYSLSKIMIDNKQHYKFLGRNIDVISLIKLYIEDEKVVRHEDWWDKKPLWNRETVKLPLAGRVLEMARRGSMLATHAMMGFGKDPTV